MSTVKLADIPPEAWTDEVITPEQVMEWLVAADAGWVHNGDPKMPHAELASGMCSNAFFFCRKLLCFPNINEILAVQLARKVDEELAGQDVDAVVGAPMSSITLSYEVAKWLCARHGMPEKDPADQKKMLWKEEFPAGTRVLRIEELITTSGSAIAVTQAVESAQNAAGKPVVFLPIVGVLVHRPPKLPINYWGMRMVALVEKEVWAVPPDKCELCRQGSKRVKPKLNWAELVGKG